MIWPTSVAYSWSPTWASILGLDAYVCLLRRWEMAMDILVRVCYCALTWARSQGDYKPQGPIKGDAAPGRNSTNMS